MQVKKVLRITAGSAAVLLATLTTATGTAVASELPSQPSGYLSDHGHGHHHGSGGNADASRILRNYFGKDFIMSDDNPAAVGNGSSGTPEGSAPSAGVASGSAGSSASGSSASGSSASGASGSGG